MSGPVLDTSFIKWEDALTPAEVDAIETYGDRMVHQKAELSGAMEDEAAVRITRVAWIDYNPHTAAFFEKLAGLVRQLNEQFYHFELTGLENFQYTVYHGSEGGHYDWHIDYGAHNPRPRKISLSVQLSDGDSYEGCDLQFQTGHKHNTAPRGRGTVIAFPSFFLHRVTPITAGTRKSLVVWAAGPIFR